MLIFVPDDRQTHLKISIMKTLTNEQLENQINSINATRFLLERTYNGSESTIKELDELLKQLNEERNTRS